MEGDSRDTSTCGKDPCPEPPSPKWTRWGAWSSCSHSCGGGRRRRKRSCSEPTKCFRSSGKVQEQLCAANPCPDEGGCGDSKCVAECPGKDLDLGLEAWEKLGDQCFLWSEKSATKNWTEAEDFCRWQGGHLVSVTSKAINEYIVEGKSQRKISSLWVGGTDKEEEGVWTWTDCSSFQGHKFTAWAHHQPSNGPDQDCVDHWSKSWNDVECSRKKAFLCTKKLCPYICPGGTKLSWDQVCDGIEDCPLTSKSNGGEDEDVCEGSGDSGNEGISDSRADQKERGG